VIVHIRAKLLEHHLIVYITAKLLEQFRDKLKAKMSLQLHYCMIVEKSKQLLSKEDKGKKPIFFFI
jgi:hypothetical protein